MLKAKLAYGYAEHIIHNLSLYFPGRSKLIQEYFSNDQRIFCLKLAVLLQEELALAGHSVRSAADGLAGLDAAEREHPDLVILDLKMPGMGGLEVLRRLKETQPSLPVLLFTAYGDFHEEARSLGADGYLVKSYDLSALADTVQKFLDGSAGNKGGPG